MDMGDEPCHPAREWNQIAVPILFVHNFPNLLHLLSAHLITDVCENHNAREQQQSSLSWKKERLVATQTLHHIAEEKSNCLNL
eukprot:11182342-Ditylum_brightwellii.AAC.1